MRRISILGSFSGRNKGDLAILRSELVQLKRNATEELTVYIFSKDVARISQYLDDIITDVQQKETMKIEIFRSYTTYIGPMTFPVLAKCDKVIIGAGGLFFDNRLWNISFSHVLNLFFVTLWLKVLGKKVMIYAVGCSHLDSKFARWMTRVILKNSKIVSVRDELSRSNFSRCTNKEIFLGNDPALMLEPKKTERVEAIEKSWPDGRKILLCLHEFMFFKKHVADHENTLKQFLNHVCEFAKQNGYFILTYSNYTNQKCASKTAELCGSPAQMMLEGENHLLPEELIYLFSKCDFVIATQMHAGIFAHLAGVPLMSLIYDDKVEEFNKLVGNQNYLYLPEMSNGSKVADILSNTAASRAVSRKAPAQTGGEKLAELLNGFVWN